MNLTTRNLIPGPATVFQVILLCALWSGQAVAATFTVTNLNDAGPGSLREAIEQANATGSSDLIEFETGLSGTIMLNAVLPPILGEVEILGPGAGVITISGGQTHQVLVIEDTATIGISGLTIAGGLAMANGGGISVGIGGGIWNQGELALADSVVTGNFAEVSGGGISNDGSLVILRSVISDNSTGEFGIGGGIENFAGSLQIVDSTISGNTADFGGGIDNAAVLAMVNSTVSGNIAAEEGGGLSNFNGQASLAFATLAANSALDGGGIWSNDQVTVKSSLVANSLGSADCSISPGGQLHALGNNLDTDGSCAGFQQTSSAALDLGPLASNGGPTLTHAIGPDSPAREGAADCTDIDGTTLVETDQRGVPRPQGGACDLGAFELEPPVMAPQVLITPASLEFGNVAVGAPSAAQAVTVENTGDADLELDVLAVMGPHEDEFTLSADTCSGQVLAPQASCSFQVTFSPEAAGPRAAQVIVASNADSSPDLVPLTGTGVAPGEPAVGIDPASLDFGDLPLGQPSPALVVIVENTGSGLLELGSLVIQGPNASDFQLAGNLCSGAEIAPGNDCQFEVVFTAQAAGVRRARVMFGSNAAGSPHSVPLRGSHDVIFEDGFEGQ